MAGGESEGSAAVVLAQHDAFCGVDSFDGDDGESGARFSEATRCVSAVSTAGSSPLARAQASSSFGVWQQQDEKHCFAELQPQGLSWQGKGCERSLAASLAVATSSPPTAIARSVSPPSGSGRPEATSECITTASQLTRRQQPGRNGLPKGHGVVGDEAIAGRGSTTSPTTRLHELQHRE